MPKQAERRKEEVDASGVSVSEAGDRLGDLVNRAWYLGERTVILRRGEPAAAIVPMSDYERLTAA
jgi:prevent-host-death family protein